MEDNGELAQKMKKCIIRAAVHASRSGKHGQSFLAPDGKAYPDVSKAFAGDAGLKPCTRCKNNKQGVSERFFWGVLKCGARFVFDPRFNMYVRLLFSQAYHCRLRRKHKELDHDGSNSPAELAPLLLVPMEELLLDPKTLGKP